VLLFVVEFVVGAAVHRLAPKAHVEDATNILWLAAPLGLVVVPLLVTIALAIAASIGRRAALPLVGRWAAEIVGKEAP
jgi:hypothetical protein